jgi:hypothetical protein
VSLGAVRFGDHSRRLLRQAGSLAELLGDLSELLGRVVGCENRGLGRQVARRDALGCLVDDDELLAGLRMWAVEDGRELEVVLRREPVSSPAGALPARPR